MNKTFNKYYNDELEVLLKLGDEFAQKNPKYAFFLEANNKSEDPDVRRLIEAFAFLTGRLRQKLDDELPELTQTLFALLWPNYLRPLPSSSILEFEITTALTGKQTIPRGISVASNEIKNKQGKGATCYFKSCYAVEIYPLAISKLEYKESKSYNKSVLTLEFELQNGLTLDDPTLLISSQRLFLHGEDHKTYKLYLWLCYFLESIEIKPSDGLKNEGFILTKQALKPIGFSDEESIFPYPESAFSGYRLLQEYFSIPEKFLFLDINQLEKLQSFEGATKFTLSFNLKTAFVPSLHLTTKNIRLHCTPIINLFEHYAEPIRLDNKKTDYPVYPQGAREYYEIFEITKVMGKQQGTGKEHSFFKFESFEHSLEFEAFEFRKNKNIQHAYFKNKLVPRVTTTDYDGYRQLQGLDTFISFVNARDNTLSVKNLFTVETISIDLLCSNGGLAESLGIGEICKTPTKISANLAPNTVSFKNITRVSPSIPPPVDTGLHWHLISSLGVNYKALTNIDALKFILSSYDFAAYIDETRESRSRQRIESIKEIKTETVNRLEKRRVLRVNQINLLISETGFGESDCEGQLFLFASVLNEFFSLYSGLNATHELNVNVEGKERRYQWTTIK